MSNAVIFYWLEDGGICTCPEEIKTYIERVNFPEKEFRVTYGSLNNLREVLEETIKNLQGEEDILFFPLLLLSSPSEIEIITEKIKNLINRYETIIFFSYPVFFGNRDLINKIGSSIIKLISNNGNTFKGIYIISDKFRTNINANLPLDWLVQLKNFIECVYYIRENETYMRNLKEMEGIMSVGFLCLEIPIRKIIDKILIESLKDYKEIHLKSEKNSFNLDLIQITTPFEIEITTRFQCYQIPPLSNPFLNKDLEYYLYFFPRDKKFDEIKESDYESKLQIESQIIVEKIFNELLESIKHFSAGLSLSFGESLKKLREDCLQKIQDSVIQFFSSGGTLYTLEKWLKSTLEGLKQELEIKADIFQPQKLIENKRGYFAPKLKELCWILLKFAYWQQFSSYKYFLFGIFVFLSLISLIFVPNVLHFILTLKNTTALLLISAILSLILTFIIRTIVLQHFRKKAYAKLEELAEEFDGLKKQLSDSLIKIFQEFVISHFLTKINIYLQKILVNIQGICFIYRRVFERTQVKPFSIGQSQLIRTKKETSIPSDAITEKTKENFMNSINTIFRNFLTINSESILEKSVISFLQEREEEIINMCRSFINPESFKLKEGDLPELIEKTKGYIAYSLPPDFENKPDVQIEHFLCKPRAIKVDIPGIMNFHPLDWDHNESILSTIFVSGIELESKKDGDKKSG